MKTVSYYCPRCRRTVPRQVTRSTPKRRSYCCKAEKMVTLRRKRDTYGGWFANLQPDDQCRVRAWNGELVIATVLKPWNTIPFDRRLVAYDCPTGESRRYVYVSLGGFSPPRPLDQDIEFTRGGRVRLVPRRAA